MTSQGQALQTQWALMGVDLSRGLLRQAGFRQDEWRGYPYWERGRLRWCHAGLVFLLPDRRLVYRVGSPCLHRVRKFCLPPAVPPDAEVVADTEAYQEVAVLLGDYETWVARQYGGSTFRREILAPMGLPCAWVASWWVAIFSHALASLSEEIRPPADWSALELAPEQGMDW